MHGCNHIYDKDTNKKIFLNMVEDQNSLVILSKNKQIKLKKGLKIFKENSIKIRTFFSPNHTYDENTFKALKSSGINEVIDGYGLKPYVEDDIKFIPQLFYKPFFLPFGLQNHSGSPKLLD